MKTAYPTTPAAPDNLHRDGAIRCDRAFHSILTDGDDQVELRVQVLVPGDLVAAVPTEVISRAVRQALSDAGVRLLASQVRFVAPEHDCEALTAGG